MLLCLASFNWTTVKIVTIKDDIKNGIALIAGLWSIVSITRTPPYGICDFRSLRTIMSITESSLDDIWPASSRKMTSTVKIEHDDSSSFSLSFVLPLQHPGMDEWSHLCFELQSTKGGDNESHQSRLLKHALNMKKFNEDLAWKYTRQTFCQQKICHFQERHGQWNF